MIIREHRQDETHSTALYSPCESYRYALTRTWAPEDPKLMFVMLNPSTATELRNDPTIERCERRARRWGYGAMRITNLFAWRATQPADLRKAAHPIGPANDEALADGAAWADMILAAWGVHGVHQARGETVLANLRGQDTPLTHLGLTKDGHPRHPLYVSYAQSPVPWHE